MSKMCKARLTVLTMTAMYNANIIQVTQERGIP